MKILIFLFLSGIFSACRQEANLARVKTTRGEFVIKLEMEEAPKHCKNFIKLAKSGFYDNLTFHRVVKDFVAQAGDPEGTGRGGPGYTIDAEISPRLKHTRGAVGAARLPDAVNPEKRSSGSQFYICLKDNFFLDGGYTVFGYVVEGMDVVDKIAVGDKILAITIE